MRTQDNIQMGEANGLLRYDKAQMGFCYLDTDLRYVEINDWLAAINGLSPAEHVGRTIGEILPSVAEAVERQLRQVIETGEPILKGLVYAETASHLASSVRSDFERGSGITHKRMKTSSPAASVRWLTS